MNVAEATRHPLDLKVASAVEETRFGDWMEVYQGGQFWPMDPRPGEVDIIDIAHSLSMQCRYAGHSLRYFSVAEHSVLIAQWLLDNGHPGAALHGLLHDAPEAYLVDVPRPVKPFLSGYREAEARVWAAIAQRFDISPDIPGAVHSADNRILVDESSQNMAPCVVPWNLPHFPLGVTLQFWEPARAEAEFLTMFNRLTEGF